MELRSERSLRILDFDCECRPIAWYGEWVTKQPTAIAWAWITGRKNPVVEVAVIGSSDRSSHVLEEEREMLETFREAYDQADIVSGHFISSFDLPLLNGACERLGLPLFTSKLIQDTKTGYIKAQGISKSQENLGALYELRCPKIGMNTTTWGHGNMLLPHGIEATKRRAIGDVRQHVELRAEMLRRGVLRPPVLWGPGTTTEVYQP